METRWNAILVGSLALSLGIYGCVSMPAAQDGNVDRLGDLVRGTEAAQRSALQLSVVDKTAQNAKSGYHVNYVNVLDWDFVRATLDKVKTDGSGGWMTDSGFTSKSNTKTATVNTSSLIRSAVVTLSNLTPGANYRITVQLVKMVNGAEKVLAQGVNDNTDHSGFTINTGSNSIDVTLALTSDGKAIVNVPPPGVSTTLSTSVSGQSSFGAVRYAGVTLDSTGSNAAITGSTPLMSVGLQQPNGLEIDENGNLFVADAGHNKILKMDGTNATVVAGTGTAGVTGDGAAATAATLSAPRGLAYVPSKKALYFADYGNDRIRMIDGTTGNIYTVAGGGGSAVSGTPIDGATASLSGPTALVIDGAGNIYFTDSNRVCKIDLDGKVSTIATVSAAGALAIDRTNKVLWVASGNLIRKITTFDTTPTLAAAAVYTFPNGSNDKCYGLAYDHNGMLYASRSYNGGVNDRRMWNELFRLPVDTTGSLDGGKSPEWIAGTQNDTAASPYGSVSATTPVANALTQGLAGNGYGGLLIDMNQSTSAANQSGILYYSQWHYSSQKGEIVKFTPSGL